MKTDHAIEVHCDADAAFALCLNVRRWPDIFPPCLEAEVLRETETSQTIAITARANDEVFSWESTRRIDRAGRAIEFSQSKTSPLVEYMNGRWCVTPSSHGCVVTLSHEFQVKSDVSGMVNGPSDREAAVRFMLRSTEENSTNELNALKLELERSRWLHEFSESLVIPQSKRAIWRLLRDVNLWPWLLPHCKTVDIRYDDRQYQEFLMEVKVGEMSESIRSVRTLSEDRIDYFQPAPPPALKEHRGRWTVAEVMGGMEVTSWHSVLLRPEFWKGTPVEEAKSKVETAINKNSLGTMRAIMNKLGTAQNAKA